MRFPLLAPLAAVALVLAACAPAAAPTPTSAPKPTTPPAAAATPTTAAPTPTAAAKPTAPATPTAAAKPATTPTAAPAAGGDPERGRQLTAARGCTACHAYAPGDAATIGPPLMNIANVAATRKPGMSAEAYIRESILDPNAFVVPGFQPVMPPFRGVITDQELNDLVAYYLTLRQ